MSGTHLRIISANIEHDGDLSGERWHTAHDILRELDPDVILRQEMTHSATKGHARLIAAENLLGMRGFMSPAPDESPNATGLFVKADRHLTVTGHFKHAKAPWKQITNVTARLAGTVTDIIMVSFHLCYFDPDNRAVEARRLVDFTRPGRIAIVGGDCNSYPEPGLADEPALPDWDNIPDKAHRISRTIWTPEGNSLSDIRVDQLMRRGGYEDAARAAYGKGRKEALQATASLTRTDQGTRRRIDRIYLSEELSEAVDNLYVLSDSQMRGASDHAFVVADLNVHTLREIINSLPQ